MIESGNHIDTDPRLSQPGSHGCQQTDRTQAGVHIQSDQATLKIVWQIQLARNFFFENQGDSFLFLKPTQRFQGMPVKVTRRKDAINVFLLLIPGSI